MHRDVHEYLQVSVISKFWWQKHKVKETVIPCFTPSLMLGKNWPGFQALVRVRKVCECVRTLTGSYSYQISVLCRFGDG